MSGPAEQAAGCGTGAGPSDSPERHKRTAAGRLVASVRRCVYRAAGLADPLCRGWRWLPTAMIVGTVPFLASYGLGVQGHQVASALGLALVVMACARRDAWAKGPAVIAMAFLAHSVLVIALASADPVRTGAVLPGSDWYWQKQITWIETGRDPEYAYSAWVPAHFQLLGAAVLLGITSFGSIAFFQGFFEVDLMNFYNAQLLNRSVSGPLALALGWHPWSLLRGVAYVFLTFEIVSLSVAWFSGVRSASRRARAWRWALGLFFLLADGAVKSVLLETVRERLFLNLR